LAIDYIWYLRLTPSQRDRFIRLANNRNNLNQNRVSRIRINNANTLDQIARISIPQITNNPLEQNFFNGVNFDDNNDLEYLILPAGCFSGSSSFA